MNLIQIRWCNFVIFSLITQLFARFHTMKTSQPKHLGESISLLIVLIVMSLGIMALMVIQSGAFN